MYKGNDNNDDDTNDNDTTTTMMVPGKRPANDLHIGATTKVANPISFLHKALSSGVIMKLSTGMDNACSVATCWLNSSLSRQGKTRQEKTMGNVD